MRVPALKWDARPLLSRCLVVVLVKPMSRSDAKARHNHVLPVRRRRSHCSKDLLEASHAVSSTSVPLEQCIRATRAGIADMAVGCSHRGHNGLCASDTTGMLCMRARECLGGSQASRQSWTCGGRHSQACRISQEMRGGALGGIIRALRKASARGARLGFG